MEGVEFPMRMVCCMLGRWLTLLFGIMPFLAIYVVPLTPRDDLHWWNTGVIYHIYPRSFQDSNGDGIGDIKGNDNCNRTSFVTPLLFTSIRPLEGGDLLKV